MGVPRRRGRPGRRARSDGLRAAAVRELREEAGIDLGSDPELVAFSNWITPARVRIRFDTWFYLAAMPAGQQPVVDGREIVDARWQAPADAVGAAERGELAVVFPTRKHLERIAAYGSAAELLSTPAGSRSSRSSRA